MNQRLNRLTRVDIESTAKSLQPDRIGWVVDVAGERFPVKQLVREAANQLSSREPQIAKSDSSFNTSKALDILQKHGFKPIHL